MTFKEASNEYLDGQKPLLTPREYDRQAGILEEHLRPFFRGKVGEISARSVEQYITLRSRKCSAATIRKEVGVLKHLLNRAMKEGKISKNPAAGVTMPRVPAGRVRYLQPTELQAVLEHCPPWLRPVVLLAVATAMRRGEILKMRWLDVDLLQRQVNLPQTKNGKGRTVYLNEMALDVFRSLALDADTQADEPVFALDVTPEEVSMCFMRACRKARINDFRFHDLRHTTATWLRQRGVQLDEIAKQLGHSDLRMTQRYAHLGASQIREAVCCLDSILRPLKGPEAKAGVTGAGVTRLQ
jgi:integrase